MPKVVSRGIATFSKDEDDTVKDPLKALSIHYCLCGEFLLVLEGPLSLLPQRPHDKSYALRNADSETDSSLKKKVYKLNAVAGTGNDALGVMVKREGGFEYQRYLHCPRCLLKIGYETKPSVGKNPGKGPATFILPGATTHQQSKIPIDAFGPKDVASPVSAVEPAPAAIMSFSTEEIEARS